MEKGFKALFKNFFNRELIHQKEGQITYFQLIGIFIMFIGIGYLVVFILNGKVHYLSSEKIAISFFMIMLGVSFAFPDLLKGQSKDLSTMRIIVFMFANVICMLLLKIGWEKASLTSIGLDGYWMGVIAFLLGAKAGQKYFENFRANPDKSEDATSSKGEIDISQIAVAQIAKVQNEGKLYAKYPNIESISETIKSGKSCITLYLKDNNVNNIPSFVDAKLNDTIKLKVQTEIVTNVGRGTPHLGQLTLDIVDSKTPNYFGSICCLVDSLLYPNFKGVITSGHIFTKGNYIDYGGYVKSNQIRNALFKNKTIGKLYYQEINFAQDIAIVELIDESNLLDNFLSFSMDFYDCGIEDLNSEKPNVTILSKGNNMREAYILDFNFTRQVYYGKTPRFVTNLVLIGTSPNKNDSETVSEGGDSGSCVYHTISGKMIGMLLGGDAKFSFVLPFDETLKMNNFKIR
jgi:hypothetical protein